MIKIKFYSLLRSEFGCSEMDIDVSGIPILELLEIAEKKLGKNIVDQQFSNTASKSAHPADQHRALLQDLMCFFTPAGNISGKYLLILHLSSTSRWEDIYLIS